MDNSLKSIAFDKSFLLFVASVGLLIAGIFFLNFLAMSGAQQIVQRFILLMMISGILVTFTSFGIHKSGILTRLGSLRWLLLIMVLFTVGVVLLNFWILSEILFSSSYYFPFITVMLFFAGLSAIGFGYFISRSMTQRITRLSDAAQHIAHGDFSVRLELEGNDEIAVLTRSFNSMAQDLEQVEEQKRQLEQTRRDLIAWVSHDLRTPLTSMRVMLEALADGIITDEETQTRYVKNTLTEIEHLSHLINDLFELAKLDVGGIQIDTYPTPIRDLLSDTIGGLMAKAKKKHIMLMGSVGDNIDLVNIAPDKIQRVLKNLIDNAIKYTPEGETVSISIAQNTNRMVQVDVHNTGVHIEADELPNLFQSFYRAEKSRATTDDERGAGLGLAIARGFVQAHGGDIWATSRPQHGTTFSFTLPVGGGDA